MNIIIIANGSFPRSAAVLQLLDAADRVVCCDGALRHYLDWRRRQGCPPRHCVAVVGDGDSLCPELIKTARSMGVSCTHATVAEQESNDLTKAVRYAVGHARSDGVGDGDIRIDILGATGLREDHTLGNISLLACYMAEFDGIGFRMLSDYGTFLPMRDHCRFASHRGEQVSLFSFTPDTPVSVAGLRYPIENRCLRWMWEGTLNEALGDSFEVWGGIAVVYLGN